MLTAIARRVNQILYEIIESEAIIFLFVCVVAAKATVNVSLLGFKLDAACWGQLCIKSVGQSAIELPVMLQCTDDDWGATITQ